MSEALRPGLFAGRTALVTGGGSGIGRVIARRFAALGAQVVVAGRHLETLAAAQREIEAAGGACLAHPTDIRQVEQVEALVAAALARFGRIDFVINNAGGQFPARPSEISDRGWRAVVDLNLNGTWNVLSRVGPHLLAQRFGRGRQHRARLRLRPRRADLRALRRRPRGRRQPDAHARRLLGAARRHHQRARARLDRHDRRSARRSTRS